MQRDIAITKHLGDGGFSRGDTAGKTNNQHD